MQFAFAIDHLTDETLEDWVAKGIATWSPQDIVAGIGREHHGVVLALAADGNSPFDDLSSKGHFQFSADFSRAPVGTRPECRRRYSFYAIMVIDSKVA